MANPSPELRSYPTGFAISKAPESERTWGRYVRGNVVRYRNYKRPVRDGISFGEVTQFYLMQAKAKAEAHRLAAMTTALYGDGAQVKEILPNVFWPMKA